MKLKILIILLILLPSTLATSHYSYELAESLKPLIEWRDYSPKAFDESISENKPIFLLLTAPSWCYWCQVYESEEYLFNPSIIAKINKDFIPVYVDADKRQDLTRQYLEGGWPSTTILTPSRERLFGYSGVRPVQNMLITLQQAVDHVNTQAFSSKSLNQYFKSSQRIPTTQQLNNLINLYTTRILQSHDTTFGGFGTGQKFPQGRSLDFSLEVYEITKDKKFLTLVQTTLQNQYTNINEIESNYNLFDPVEGGFHRYGTRRDYTPPHYEKMLYDNVRLLKAYHHLLQITPNDPLVQEVVTKTNDYILKNWYDPSGGFYGNTDVHGEEHYYGQNPRPFEKPRVEPTKYTDWNSDAILTYLNLYTTTNNIEYKKIAETSLDFYTNEMITTQGAYHFKNLNEKAVRGSLLDNAYLLLALTEGYEVLKKDSYLKSSKVIADYSLNNLYDYYSGGFFERNSPDKELYAGDSILLSKPSQENGIMAFALLKLYTQTNDQKYLNAAIKTIGNKLFEAGSLDRGYYSIKAAQFIVENNLLEKFTQETIPNNYWLDTFITTPTKFIPSEEGLDKLEAPILLLLLIALVAGFISFASPCSLPILPAYLAYTFKASQKNLKSMTLFFFLGLTITFTILGMSATLIGNFLKSNLKIFSQVTGSLIILFGLSILIGKGFSGFKIKTSKPTSYIGSFFFGSVLGISWTPCVGPILVAILLLASTTSSVFKGGLLLFIYGVGISIPLILISTYLSKVNKEGRLWKIIEGKEINFKFFKIHSTSLISGLLFLILGYLIFSGTLFTFNQYISATSFQKFIFKIEEFFLNLVK